MEWMPKLLINDHYIFHSANNQIISIGVLPYHILPKVLDFKTIYFDINFSWNNLMEELQE